MEIGELLSCLYKFERAGKIPTSWLPAPVAAEAIDLELLGETGPITKSTIGPHEVSTVGFLIARWAQKALPFPSPSWLPQLRDVHPTWDPEWNIRPRLSEPETGQPYPALFSDVPVSLACTRTPRALTDGSFWTAISVTWRPSGSKDTAQFRSYHLRCPMWILVASMGMLALSIASHSHLTLPCWYVCR